MVITLPKYFHNKKIGIVCSGIEKRIIINKESLRFSRIENISLDEAMTGAYDLIILDGVYDQMMIDYGYSASIKLQQLISNNSIVVSDIDVCCNEFALFVKRISCVEDVKSVYVFSNKYCWINDNIYFFAKCNFKSWENGPKTNKRFYLSDSYLIKGYLPNIKDAGREGIVNERDFLNENKLDFVPRYIEYEENDYGLFVVYEIDYGKSFYEIIKDHEKHDPEQIVEQILYELVELEKRGWYHADLRTWNIIICDNVASLIDFEDVSRKPYDVLVDPITNRFKSIYSIFISFVYDVLQGKDVFDSDEQYGVYVSFDLNNIDEKNKNFILACLFAKQKELNFGFIYKNWKSKAQIVIEDKRDVINRIERKTLDVKTGCNLLIGRPWVLYGAGCAGKDLAHQYPDQVIYFIDTYLSNQVVEEWNVYCAKEIEYKEELNYIITVQDELSKKDILETLIDSGVQFQRIFIYNLFLNEIQQVSTEYVLSYRFQEKAYGELQQKIRNTPEIYQRIWNHSEYDYLCRRKCEDRFEIIKEYIGQKIDAKSLIVDFGCAQGYFALSFAEQGYRVYGVDICKENIELCMHLLGDNALDVSFECRELDLDMVKSMKKENNSAALLLNVVHHIANSKGFEYARTIVEELCDRVDYLIVEFALYDEPETWSNSLPKSVDEWMINIPNHKILKMCSTHLSQIERPLMVLSSNKEV